MPESQVSLKKFYSVNEMAETLSCHPVTIRRWVLDGTIPSIKLGGRRLIPFSVIDRMIEETLARERSAQ